MPRPSKLTPALQAAIVNAVRHGVSPSRAGILAGLDPTTVPEWIEIGEGRRQGRIALKHFVEFAQAVKRAWVEDEQRRIKRIEAAGKGGAILRDKRITTPDGTTIREVERARPQWQADAWWLERTRREDYALHTRLDTTHDVSPALLALQQQWQALREAPVEARALPPGDLMDAEATPSPAPTPGATSKAATFAMLDALNRREEPDDEEEDDA